MKVNEIYSGFKLVKVSEVKDLKATIYEFKHIKSNGNLVFIEADDNNKSFAYGFRTLPEDSTGVCHIIEHTMLNGSEKYPLKEPFVNLLKGSMNTFLNAFTAYDWTCYPVASMNDKDFDNLMDVYLDAVLHPLSIKDPKAFLQEGWHYEMMDKDSTPSYKGVVYNEMIGATSSVDEQLQEATLAAMYQGTGYGVNSGGDPEVIPTLTYDYYKNFYKEHYHPSNGLIVLYGNMNILEKLEYIDKEYLSKYDWQEPTVIEKPKKLINRDFSKQYAISKDEDVKDNTYYSISFGLCDYENQIDFRGLNLLFDVLMGSNDSPLKKRLLDSKLFQDVYYNISDDCIVSNIMFAFNKSNEELKDKIYDLLIKSLKEIREEGIDKKLLIASINSSLFRIKEADYGRTPKGLIYSIGALQNFVYNIPVEDAFDLTSAFDYFKKEMDNGFFENLLDKYILNSDFYSIVTLNPSKTLEEEKQVAMKEKMAKLKENWSEAEIEEVVKQTQDLIEYQSREDTPEALASLPKLALSDLKTKIDEIPTVVYEENEVKVIEHDFDTNGIGYLSILFNVKTLTVEELLYEKILKSVLRSLDTENYTARDMQTYIQTWLGNFSFYNGLLENQSRDLIFNLKVSTSALKENIGHISIVFNEIINKSIYDPEKIKTIVKQMQLSARDSIISSGTSCAVNEALSNLNKISALDNQINGIGYYRFLTDVVNKDNFVEVAKKLESIAKKIFTKSNLIVSYSGDKEIINDLKEEVKKFDLREESYEDVLDVELNNKKAAALCIPSGVSYNAKVFELGYNYIDNLGKLFVAAHIINYDYLWSAVRVKGGAYGCSINAQRYGTIVLSSYRDPNVKNTYDAFKNISEYLRNLDLTEEDYLSYLIGAVSSRNQPKTPLSLISLTDNSIVANLNGDEVNLVIEEMINTKFEDVKALCKELADKYEEGYSFTIGSEAKIKESELFDEIENL